MASTAISSSVSADRADPPAWIETAARAGYAAKALLYTVVGVLAFRVGRWDGSSTSADAKGALREIGAGPFGQVLLAITALGLLGYSLWRFVEVIKDPVQRGTDFVGIVGRLGCGVSGLAHLSLAYAAARSALGGGEGSRGEQSWTAELLAQPFGQFLVVAVGAILAGVGIHHFVRAYRAEFMTDYGRSLRGTKAKVAEVVGRFGLTARGLTFVILGGFFIVAGVQHDATEAGGLAATFATLLAQPYGRWLVTVVAAGFLAYGAYCAFNARYRRLTQ